MHRRGRASMRDRVWRGEVAKISFERLLLIAVRWV